MGISQYLLAKDISVHPRRINEIVHGNRSISADTALRLSRYFGLSERFWLNFQARYDIEVEKDRLEGRLENEVKVLCSHVTFLLYEFPCVSRQPRFQSLQATHTGNLTFVPGKVETPIDTPNRYGSSAAGE